MFDINFINLTEEIREIKSQKSRLKPYKSMVSAF